MPGEHDRFHRIDMPVAGLRGYGLRLRTDPVRAYPTDPIYDLSTVGKRRLFAEATTPAGPEIAEIIQHTSSAPLPSNTPAPPRRARKATPADTFAERLSRLS